jgi:protease secretion system outer membrane protein
MALRFKNTRLAALLALGLALHGAPAAALGLMEAYRLAQNDPAYRSAYYAGEAGKENRILGRSNLLPRVSASYSASQNRTTVTALDTSIGDVTYPRDYLARSSAVQLRQPLLNLDGLARYRQGKAQSDYATAQFESQQQEVIVRVVNAYLDVLFKGDLLRLSEVQRDTLEEQRKVNDRLFKGGEGTPPTCWKPRPASTPRRPCWKAAATC